MKKILKMKDFKDANMHKIEGEDFVRLKEVVKKRNEAFDTAKKLAENAHKNLWDTIYDIIGKKSKSDSLQLIDKYEELGFYIIQKNESNFLSDLLSNLQE